MFQYFRYFFLLFTVIYTALNSYKSQTCNKNISSAPEVNLYLFRPVVTLVKKENKTAVSSLITGKKKTTKKTQLLHSSLVVTG